MVKSLVDRMVPNATSSWHADETVVKVSGDYRYFWDCIDYESRFIVMTMMTTTRSNQDAKKFFKGAKQRVGGENPNIIVTDGCGAYRKGVSSSFWRKISMGDCTYIKKPGLRARIGTMSNNLIERFHNTIKERAKTTRWFKSDDGAGNWLDGFVIQYNFLRPHTSLGGITPAEKAGLELPFLNGWGNLIQWASTNREATTLRAYNL